MGKREREREVVVRGRWVYVKEREWGEETQSWECEWKKVSMIMVKG